MFSNFSNYSLLPLIPSILVFLLGLFIWLKKPREWLYLLFFLYNLTISIWLFGTAMLFSATSDHQRIYWDRFIYVGVVFIPIFLYHFGLIYCQVLEKQKWIAVIGYLIAFVFLPLSQLSDSFVSGLFKYGLGVHSIAHRYHHIFLVYFFFYFILFFVNLVRHYRRSQGKHKQQVRWVLIGYGILDVIGPLAFLPAYHIPITPAIFLCAIPFALILAYAIVRYQALDIKLIGVEIIVAFINILIIATIFWNEGETQTIIKMILWLGIVIFSYILTRYVRGEVYQREQITNLATSLKETVGELSKSNAQLKELDQQKTEFLTIAAHQLRTPLSIIKGYVSLLLDGSYGKLKEEVKGVLGNIDESNQWLIRLADEFINIARIEQGRVKYSFMPVDLRTTIDSVVLELNAKATPRGLTIKWERPKEQQVAEVDQEKIRYAMFNLLDNAIKYTDTGTIEVATIAADEGYIFTVRDHGIGFDVHDQANFFQKFYRGQNVHTTNVNGTGLGLYVCSKFIKAHHGRIWAKSKGLGQGSEFGFWIPQHLPAVALTGDSAVSAAIPLLV